ncbi:S8 family serine peptidase [Streptomyces sp. NPDC052015]|uniref:S8 family serine peptidase n=1 Tax=Streptomyces sp. NPDC052015 TaxID=3154755 RepID=UPI0034415BAB
MSHHAKRSNAGDGKPRPASGAASGMPVPSAPGTPAGDAGGMPVPGGSPASVRPETGGMQAPGMRPAPGSGGQDGMPTPGMPAPSGSGMPRPTDAMSARGEQPGGAPRNAPVPGGGPSAAPGDGRTPLPRFGGPEGIAPHGQPYEPGVVEVEFRDGVTPAVTERGEGAPAEVSSLTEGPLTDFNSILAANGLVSAEPTFDITPEEATAVQANAAARGHETPHLARFLTLHFADDADTVAIAQRLDALPEVQRAVAVPTALPPTVTAGAGTLAPVAPLTEPLVGTSGTVVVDTATGLENQWYLFRCAVDQAWSRRSTGRGVVVADVDWGYRTSHQDLAPNIARTFNSFDGTADVTHGDSVGHGTAVLGLSGASANRVGMAGIAYDATLWAVQADSGTSPGIGGNPWARGIDWVRTTDSGGRRKVVILEVQTGAFGNYEQVPSVNAAIRTAIAEGVVVCVAAGNGDRDASVADDGTPIPETGSILVGATAYDATVNRRAWFSNFGSRIVVCAPGDSSHDLTCDSGSDSAYRNGFGGTSGAAPKVAGAAALMLAANPALTHADVRRILRATGTPVTPDPDPAKEVGTFLNAGAATREAAQDAVGRLEVFARGGDQAVWHKWQTAVNNGWSGWESLGGWVDLVSHGRNADGRLEIFARGADQALWHMRQNTPGGGWSGWESLGGWIDDLGAAQNNDGRLEVFARGADQALWHKWQTAVNDGWSGWASLGGWIDLMAVDNNGDGRLEVFARGADRALWHTWQTAPGGGWSGWESLGGWIDQLATARNADGRLEIFARGADQALWHMRQTAPGGGWSGWESLGGWIDMIAPGRNADGRLEVFARGADQALWHKWQTAPGGGWSGWESLGGWIDDLHVSRNNDGRLEVFARGADQALWHKWQTAAGDGWSGWESLGGWIDRLDVGQNAL